MLAKINKDDCKCCGNCTDICPCGAITLKEDKFAVNNEICVGCGCCKDCCPCEAIDILE